MKTQILQRILVCSFVLLPVLVVGQYKPSFPYIAKYEAARDKALGEYYQVELQLKKLSSDDTTSYSAKVKQVKLVGDTVFGGQVFIDMDSIWVAYDGMYLYSANRQTMEVERYAASKFPTIFIGGTNYNYLLRSSFLNPTYSLVDIVNDPTISVFGIPDTMINRISCQGFQLLLPDSDLEDRFILMLFEKGTYLPAQIVRSSFFQGNEEYMSSTFQNFGYYDWSAIPELHQDSLAQYKLMKDIDSVEDLVKDGAIDTSHSDVFSHDFTSLNGVSTQDNSPLHIRDISSRLIVMDYWFSGCYPCIQSIPYVNDLVERVKNMDVTVLGVNPVDKPGNDNNRIQRFLKYNPMKYNSMIVDEGLRKSLPFIGYPTIIILDENRKVVMVKEGMDEDEVVELFEFIKSRL